MTESGTLRPVPRSFMADSAGRVEQYVGDAAVVTAFWA